MKRCALIIGNNAYPDAILKNAVNDANDIAAKLGEIGFACVVLPKTIELLIARKLVVPRNYFTSFSAVAAVSRNS
jgi:hypothetical protein